MLAYIRMVLHIKRWQWDGSPKKAFTLLDKILIIKSSLTFAEEKNASGTKNAPTYSTTCHLQLRLESWQLKTTLPLLHLLCSTKAARLHTAECRLCLLCFSKVVCPSCVCVCVFVCVCVCAHFIGAQECGQAKALLAAACSTRQKWNPYQWRIEYQVSSIKYQV